MASCNRCKSPCHHVSQEHASIPVTGLPLFCTHRYSCNSMATRAPPLPAATYGFTGL
ncbi:hypothetical protein AMATHDRAFT_60166, partial [Amanita thiersii Skay4041]